MKNVAAAATGKKCQNRPRDGDRLDYDSYDQRDDYNLKILARLQSFVCPRPPRLASHLFPRWPNVEGLRALVCIREFAIEIEEAGGAVAGAGVGEPSPLGRKHRAECEAESCERDRAINNLACKTNETYYLDQQRSAFGRPHW